MKVWWKAVSLTLAAALVGVMSPGAPARADQALVKRGAYLVQIMGCGGCHTPMPTSAQAHPAALSGATVGFEMDGLGVFYPPNLTSDKETGLGNWSAKDIETAMRTGVRPDGRELAPVMPWQAFSVLTPDDMAAVIAFLQSLAPVKHQVPEPVGAGAKAPLPYYATVMPK
ncbi:Cytochrome c [Tistlia consotensis]|uniref:Cytochrome c n=1 Tax=Tistlia consotensis USBA 355 TaxID=560819 RepID=A0A1Y6BLB7_9PROT|nr:c-type cytochrome [Tistlia consotensis]SMF09470.1 Cytochrome c [Tistlia consotensis USBA 355]SNR34512.1 Cytochrome c [Tistlia consotensis]